MKGFGLAAVAAVIMIEGTTLPSCDPASLATQPTAGFCARIDQIADLPVPSAPHGPDADTIPDSFFERLFGGGAIDPPPAYRPEREKHKTQKRHVAPPHPELPVTPTIRERLPVVAAEPTPPPGTNASESPTVTYADQRPTTSGGAPVFIAVGFVTVLLLIGALFVGAHFGEASERSRQEWKALQDNERIKSLRKEREIVRLSNQVDDAREWAKLRDLRIEAAKAGLQGKAGERWIDWVVTKQALDQLLNGGPREEASPPLAMAERHLLEEIESRKADGRDSHELELALQRMRQAGVS